MAAPPLPRGGTAPSIVTPIRVVRCAWQRGDDTGRRIGRNGRGASIAVPMAKEAMSAPAGLVGLARVLRERDYAIYCSGNSVSLIGTWVQRIATGWLTWEMTGSGAWLGLMAFADLAPAVLVGPLAGAVADRADRLRLIRIGQFLCFIIASILCVLAATGLIGIYSLLALTLASGVVQAFIQPVRLSLISALVPRDKLPGAVAINSIIFNVARFVGPAIAGLAIAGSGVGLAFGINAASFAVFLIALTRIRAHHSDQPVRRDKVGLGADLVAGFRYTTGHPGLAAMFVLLIATCLGARPVVELLPGFADVVFDAGATGLAVLTSSIGIGAVLGGLWIGGRPDPARLPRTVAASAVLLSLALLAFIAVSDLHLAVPAMVVSGFAIAITGIGSQTIIHLAVASEMRGRVLSMYGVVFRGGPALGALAIGAVSDKVGLAPPFALAALMIIAVVGWLAARLDRVRAALSLGES